MIGKELNEVACDRDIDYAVYSVPNIGELKCSMTIGDSHHLKIGDQVTIIGYPDHNTGNSPYIQTCSITSRKKYMGALFYTVSGRIVHGASGGIVLNTDNQAIGIIKGGIAGDEDDSTTANQGFVPLHLMLDHLSEIQSHPQ